jgi:glycosyltransferase involved in cell wall biosynthesis
VRILFVAETASIHTARWVNQLKGTGWDVHVFQGSAPGFGIAPEFEFGTLHVPSSAPQQPGVTIRQTGPTGYLLDRVRSRIASVDRSLGRRHFRYFGQLVERLKPDVIHSLALNVNWRNLSLPVLQARRELGERFTAPWVYSSWGSDLDYYALESAEHRAEAEALLGACDYYIAECDRDARLAKEFGFRGEYLGKLPAFGGADWEHLQGLRQPGLASERRRIFLKGRDQTGGDPVGRAMTAMRAFELCLHELDGYQIVIGQAVPSVVKEAARLSAMGLDIRILPRLPYDDLLRLVGSSRVSMALTVNDGLPNHLVEALALGALPLHSELEPIAEWVEDGANGLLVEAEDVEGVAVALRRALTDDVLIDRAAEVNSKLVRERLSDDVVRPKVVGLYEHVAAQGRVLC